MNDVGGGASWGRIVYCINPVTDSSDDKNSINCGCIPRSSCNSSSSASSCSNVYSPESNKSLRGDSKEKAPLHQISPVTTPAASSRDIVVVAAAAAAIELFNPVVVVVVVYLYIKDSSTL